MLERKCQMTRLRRSSRLRRNRLLRADFPTQTSQVVRIEIDNQDCPRPPLSSMQRQVRHDLDTEQFVAL